MKRTLLTVLAIGAVIMTTPQSANAQEAKTPQKFEEKDGFVWYRTRTDGHLQILDKDQRVIIPASRGYNQGKYKPEWGKFTVWTLSGKKTSIGMPEAYYGVCLKDGTEMISTKRRYTSCSYSKNAGRYTVKKGNSCGICDSTGRELISPDLGYTSCSKSRMFYLATSPDGCEGLHDYETGKMLVSAKRGYHSISYNPVRDFLNIKKDGLCGICKKDGTELIPPVWYDCIYNTLTKTFRGKRTKDSQWEDINLSNPVPHN